MWPKCPLHFCSGSPQVSQVPDLLDVPYTGLSTISAEIINTAALGVCNHAGIKCPISFRLPSTSFQIKQLSCRNLNDTLLNDFLWGPAIGEISGVGGGRRYATHKIPNLISLMRLGTLWTTCSFRNSPELGAGGCILLPN